MIVQRLNSRQPVPTVNLTPQQQMQMAAMQAPNMGVGQGVNFTPAMGAMLRGQALQSGGAPMQGPAPLQVNNQPSIARQQAMAQALAQQAQDPLQGQMVSGRYLAPSLAQGLNKVFSAYLSGRLGDMAEQRQQAQNRDLVQAYTGGDNQALMSLALRGNEQAQQALMQQKQAQMQRQADLQAVEDEQRIKAQYDKPQQQRLYELAVEQGYKGTIRDFVNEGKRAGAMQIVMPGETQQGSGFFEKLDEKSADMFIKSSDAGIAANSKLAQINRLDSLLSQSGSGFGTMAKLYAADFGLDLGEGVSEAQAARALVSQLVPQQRPPGSGPMSDADLDLFKQSLPRLINTPEGNALIIQTMRGIAEYEKQLGGIADQVIARQMTPEQAREQMRELQNPLAAVNRFIKGEDAPPAPEGVNENMWRMMTPEQREQYNALGAGQ